MTREEMYGIVDDEERLRKTADPEGVLAGWFSRMSRKAPNVRRWHYIALACDAGLIQMEDCCRELNELFDGFTDEEFKSLCSDVTPDMKYALELQREAHKRE